MNPAVLGSYASKEEVVAIHTFPSFPAQSDMMVLLDMVLSVALGSHFQRIKR